MPLVAPTLAALLLGAYTASPTDTGDFPAFVWRGPDAAESEGAAELLAPFGGVVVVGSDEAAWAREQGLEIFVFNAPGRDTLHLDREDPAHQERHQAWYEDRDDARLLRRPCLTDPSTLDELQERLARSLAARDGDHGHGVSLGDEVSLTPSGSPGDECLSASCRAAWARSGRADMARYSTDAVRLELTGGGTELLGGWLERRRFHQDVVIDVLADLAGAVREHAPGTPVGLLGLGGQTAFGNVAVERALPLVEFIECYPVADARELMFTLRKAEQLAWATVFPDPTRPHRAAWQAWEHWMRGGDGVVVWKESVLAEAPEACRRTARALADIRRVRAQVPRFRPRPQGVAIVHSPGSVAVSWLRDALLDGPTWPRRLSGYHERNGTLERALASTLRLLEDLHTMPGALPIELVDSATVQRFPVLIASHLLLLSDAQVAALTAYLEAGGTLVVAGQLGVFDERGARRADGAVRDALRAVSERVLDAPSSARRERTGERPHEPALARELSLEQAPWRLLGDDASALPWLSTWAADGHGGMVGATLPNLSGRLAGRASRDVELEIEPPEGFALRWIHPSAAAGSEGRTVLPAGDAAVFRLVRSAR